MNPIIIQNQAFVFSHGLNLTECERDIENVEKFSDLVRGERFDRIKEKKLYKETHNTWENYCQSRWQLTPQRVNQLIAFAETCQLFKSETQVSVLPESETQTRPLNQLPPEEKITTWTKAVEAASGAQPSPDQVRAATAKNYELHFCPQCLRTWKLDKSSLFYFPTLEKSATTKSCPNCENPTPNPQKNRFCYNCNHEQILADKDIIYNNEIQCSNCKHHSRTKGWLTEPGEAWKYCPTCKEIWKNSPVISYRQDKNIYKYNEEKTCPTCEHKAKQEPKITKPYYPRPETAINFLTNISPEMTITINEIDISIADPGLKYEIINRIYEKIMQDQEPNILGELANLW